jgi:uncharacterized protein YjbI with pentapeptide repeats
LANPEHLAKLKKGVQEWNKWRKSNLTVVPDLSGADLREANLIEAYLRKANFREAELSGVDLSGANLSRADFHEARLCMVNLNRADLTRANLSGADLTRAGLSRANLTGAYLREAYLRDANLSETVFGDTNLKDAQGLDACHHLGPSILDHRTLSKSGPLPLVFLRGCGLPDEYIDYLSSLFNEAIQFCSCFISYSTKDQEFADRLYADLQSKGVRCWFASQDLRGRQEASPAD